MLELELLLPLRQDSFRSDCTVNESMQLVISKARGGYESSFGLWANLLNFRQPACDARAERLGDQLDTSRADVLAARIQRHDLAVFVAANGGKDGAPSIVPELVVPELDGRQPAISSECWC